MKVFSWSALVITGGVTVWWVINGVTESMSDGDPFMAWMNPWMTGPLMLAFVPMFFTFSRVGGKVPAALRGAPIGRGTVTGVRRTGTTVNEQPELEFSVTVDASDGSSFPATVRLLVDLTQLASLQPGIVLPVRYLPGQPKKGVAIATDALPAEVQAAFDAIQLAHREISRSHYDIGARGVEADAVVMAMTPAGVVREGKSVLHLVLQIQRPDGSSFTVEQDRPIHAALVSRVQPGNVLRVRYLPSDETDYVIITPASMRATF